MLGDGVWPSAYLKLGKYQKYFVSIIMVECLKENVCSEGNECSRLSYFFVQLVCWINFIQKALDKSTHVGDLQYFSLC